MLFNDTQEQSRQDRRTSVTGMTGSKKNWAAFMGYKGNGEMNTWGRIMGVMSPLHSLAARSGVKKMSEGTDAQGMIDETQGEFMSKTAAQYNVHLEAAKLAATVVGAGAVPGVTPAPTTTGSTLGSTVGATAGGTAGAVPVSGGDMSSVMGAGSDSLFKFNAGGSGAIDASGSNSGMTSNLNVNGDMVVSGGDPYDMALNSDVGKKMTDLQSMSNDEKTKEKLADAQKEQEKIDKQKKLKAMAEGAPGIVGAIMNASNASRTFRDKEDSFKKKLSERKLQTNVNYL